MPLGILSRKYRTETRGFATDLAILQACIGERIQVVTELYFDQILLLDYDTGSSAFFNPPSYVSGRSYNNDLIYFENDSFLNNAQIGDTFINDSVSGTLNPGFTFVLLEKISSNVGRFDIGFNQDNAGAYNGQYIANVTQLKSLIYQYGINETGEFLSSIDGSVKKATISSGTALAEIVSQALSLNGNKDWQADVVLLQGTGYDAHFSGLHSHPTIRVTHTVRVTPMFLVGELENLQNGIAPDYFKADNKIKYYSQIDWNKSNSFLDPSKTISLDPVGQFGWFNTKFNGEVSDYSMTSLTIQRVSDSEFVNQLEYNEMEVKFTLASVSGNFSAVTSRLVFGFNYLPQDKTLYQNTNRSQATNFCIDSLLFTPNGVVVNGDNFGTSNQIIKTVSGHWTSPFSVDVTVRILFGADRVSILEQEDVANYAMWCIVEKTSLDVELCDKTNLLIQVDEIHVQLTTVDLLDSVTKFLEHPTDVVGNGVDTLELFPVDDVVANSVFSLDYTGLEEDGILLKSCTPQIVLTHATETDIVLDSFKINLDNFPTIGSSPEVQAIDYNQLRPYKIENGIRKSISFERDFSEDTLSTKYFVLNFPFMNRWEYWLQLAGITSIPESLFDTDTQFNGANHLWNRLANSAGWSLKYRVTFQILQNGELFEQEFDTELTSAYFEANTDWNNCNIKTYDNDTNDEIIVGPKRYAWSNKDTKVICSFEKTVGDVPDIDHIAIVIWAEGFEGGGVSEISRISSVYEVTDVSSFRSVDTSNKVKITKTGDVFTGEALLRFDKIQNLSKVTLYARIYEMQDIIETGRITNDFILRYTNDGQVRLILS